MENGVMMQYFEWNLPNDGKLWTQLKEDAVHLHEIGVTAVWIPPAYKADEQQDEGYATYDLYDLGEFDQKGTVRTKYGTKQELREAIEALHANGIEVYLDAVMNHKCGGDYDEKFPVVEVDPADRNRTVGEPFEMEGTTGYDFKGRAGKYSDFEYHWYHFSGISTPQDPDYAEHIFRILGEGKSWSESVDEENGNYDYLLGNDLDLDHPEVVEDLIRWGRWVTEELDLDGMRLDAIKHMKAAFVKQFLETVRASRKGRFFAVGEYWNSNFDDLENYLDMVGKELDLFDVPLHFKFFEASQKGRDYDLTDLPSDTLTVRYPQHTVTFVDNHDSQHGCSLESQIEDWFKPLAYGLILSMEKGYPCLFYGDYYGVGGQPSPHRQILDILLDARRRYAYGVQDLYFDHPNTVGLVRRGDADHPGSGLALLLSNGEDGEKEMCVGEERRGQTWHEITGCIDGCVTVGEDGRAPFRVCGGKLAVWVEKE